MKKGIDKRNAFRKAQETTMPINQLTNHFPEAGIGTPANRLHDASKENVPQHYANIEDLLDHKQAEEIRYLLSSIVDSSDDAIISKTLEGNITSWNKGAEKIFGYQAHEVIGKHITILIPPELYPEEEMVIGKIKAGQQVLHFDTIRLTKDGTRVNISLTVSPLKDKEGKVTGASKIARDITEQVNARNRIEESERRYQEMIYSSAAMICVLEGENFVISIANDAILETWGKGKNVIGKPLLEVLPEIIEQGFGDILHKVYSTGEVFYAYEIPIELIRNGKKELSYYTLTYQAQRNIKGIITGIVVIADEVTPQATFNKKIKESEENFRQLAELMPEKISTADGDGNIIYYNQNWLDYTGLSLEELKNWGWSKIIHPGDIGELNTSWKHSVDTGKDFEKEFRILHKDGEFNWHMCRSKAVKDNTGKIIKWIAATTEIQQQKEEQEELENAVAQRTYELQKVNQQLLQSNNDLMQFAHVASHDLREPLRKISTFINRLKEDTETTLSGKGKIYIAKVQSASTRMNAMIEGVLNYSMIEVSEKLMEEVDLDETIKNIEADLEIIIEEKEAILKYSHLPKIEGAAILIYQLFYNLVNNSLKFAKEEEKQVITISSGIILRNNEEFAEIILEDNGIGFNPEMNEKIFSPFVSLNPRDKYEGTGLGLTLCKKIAERHGGTLTGIGAIQKGAIFTVTLPLKQKNKQ